MQFPSQMLRVNGLDMRVIITGEGPDILLVHGFPDTHDVWRKQIPALVAAGYRVIAPDTRGCGETTVGQRTADYHIRHLVADLHELLAALNIKKVKIIAHDWGAVIAWHFVIAYPEQVDRYVAMSVGHPNAYARAGITQKLKGYYTLLFQFRGLIEFAATRCNWLLFRLWTRYPEQFESWRKALSRTGRLTAGLRYYRANLGLLLPKKHPPVTVPVLGIWSNSDQFLTESQMLASRQYVQGTWQYARLDGVNHWMQLSAPETVNTLLLEYLSSKVNRMS